MKEHDLKKAFPLAFFAAAPRSAQNAYTTEGQERSPNILLWNANDIYALRSEMLQFRGLLARIEQSIRSTYEKSIQTLVRREEREERRLQQQKEDIEELPRRSPKIKDQRERRSHRRAEQTEDSANADWIWEMSGKFFRPILNFAEFNKYFIYSKEMYDMNDPLPQLGTHYSKTRECYPPQSLRHGIRVMPSVFGQPIHPLLQSYAHRRVLAALVLSERTIEGPEPKQLDDLRALLVNAERETIPDSTKLGTTWYGSLTIDMKIKMELEYLGLASMNEELIPMDDPISEEIVRLKSEEHKILVTANGERRTMQLTMQHNKDQFIARFKARQHWDRAFKEFIQEHDRDKSETKRSKKDSKRKAKGSSKNGPSEKNAPSVL